MWVYNYKVIGGTLMTYIREFTFSTLSIIIFTHQTFIIFEVKPLDRII